ncbi:TPA: hypothetical protein QB004_002048 [Pasteurella multocida]|nr:hypothetical protein [Pasteurella multocida]HDR0710826.1 hypothetical protein [Pasteurella multocida]
MPSWALTTENVYLEAKRYSNIEEFKIKNSNCCELTNFINEGDGDISKDTYGYIRVEYFIHYIQSVPADKQIFYLEYTPCGELKGIVDTFTR